MNQTWQVRLEDFPGERRQMTKKVRNASDEIFEAARFQLEMSHLVDGFEISSWRRTTFSRKIFASEPIWTESRKNPKTSLGRTNLTVKKAILQSFSKIAAFLASQIFPTLCVLRPLSQRVLQSGRAPNALYERAVTFFLLRL